MNDLSNTSKRRPAAGTPAKSPDEAPTAASSMFDAIEIEMEARLGTLTLTIKELMELDLGAVVALDRTIADPIDLLLKDKLVARGEIVTVGDSFAIRITEIMDIR